MNLKESIYRTIAFFDLFDFPLTVEEVKKYLYGYEKPVHIKEIEGTLKELPGITAVRDYFVLEGREPIIENRKQRKFISEKLWARTNLYGGYLLKLPFVKMVAVCNNLAYDNASEKSDIDLFIVLKEGRMWTARFFITAVLQFFGVRRHGDKVAGRFCLSFFVDETAMDMKKIALDKDPYLAYWVKTLSPLFGKSAYAQFKEVNADYLALHSLKFEEAPEKHFFVSDKSKFRGFLEKLLSGRLGNFLEKRLEKSLKKRTLRKMKHLGPESGIVVTDHILKFHDRDRRKEYQEAWEKKVQELISFSETETLE